MALYLCVISGMAPRALFLVSDFPMIWDRRNVSTSTKKLINGTTGESVSFVRGLENLAFITWGYFGVVKAWKVLPAIKHKVVQPPAAALILSLLFLAWLLFALCHLFPVSSFVRPLQAPSTPPPPLLIRLGWRPLKNARWGTNMHRQTPICQYLQVSVPILQFRWEWCVSDKNPSNILGRANKGKVAANAFVTRIGIRALWLPTRLVITDRPHFVKMSTNLSRLSSNI